MPAGEAGDPEMLRLRGVAEHTFEVSRGQVAQLLFHTAMSRAYLGVNLTDRLNFRVREDRAVVYTPKGTVWKSPQAAALIEAAAVLSRDYQEPLPFTFNIPFVKTVRDFMLETWKFADRMPEEWQEKYKAVLAVVDTVYREGKEVPPDEAEKS